MKLKIMFFKIVFLSLFILNNSCKAEPTNTLDISIVTDWETVQYFGSVDATKQAIQTRLNAVIPIYANQMGITLTTSYIEIPASPNQDTVPTDTSAPFLLQGLINYRNNSPQHASHAATILVTTRTLIDLIIGYSYTDSVCNSNAVGVVEISHGVDYDKTVFAHELGHILGANHDSDPLGACPNVTDNYIMSSLPFLNNSSTFSQCSIDVIKSYIPSHQCMKPIAPNNSSVISSEGGGGSMNILFIVLIMLFVFIKNFVKELNYV